MSDKPDTLTHPHQERTEQNIIKAQDQEKCNVSGKVEGQEAWSRYRQRYQR